MKEHVYKPKLEAKSPFKELEIVLKVPSVLDQMDYLEQCNLKTDDKGEIDLRDVMSKISMTKKLIQLSEPHYKAVHVLKKDGVKIASFQEMLYDQDCKAVLIDIGSQIVNGFQPSKN